MTKKENETILNFKGENFRSKYKLPSLEGLGVGKIFEQRPSAT
ncbi:hypothetical protein [Pontibacter arcticus]|nr:hypothetical protein [Pontibacter arcticus]